VLILRPKICSLFVLITSRGWRLVPWTSAIVSPVCELSSPMFDDAYLLTQDIKKAQSTTANISGSVTALVVTGRILSKNSRIKDTT